jgi:hypothetical protein
VYSNGSVFVEPGAIVHAGSTENAGFALTELAVGASSATSGTENVNVADGEVTTLAPGNYNSISVQVGGTLLLVAGEYGMNTLWLPEGAHIGVDTAEGATTLRISSFLWLTGNLGATWGTLAEFVIYYLGTSNLTLPSGFNGQLVAPNARVIAGDGTSTQGFLGRVLASELYLLAGASLSEYPATPVVFRYHVGFAGEIGAGTVPREEVTVDETHVQPTGGGLLVSDYATNTLTIQDSRTYRWQLPTTGPAIATGALQAAMGARPYVLMAARANQLPTLTPTTTLGARFTLDGIWLGSLHPTDGRLVIAGVPGDRDSTSDFAEVLVRQCTLDPGGIRADHDPIAPVRLVVRGRVRRLTILHSIVGAIEVDTTTDPQNPGRIDELVIENSIVDGSGFVGQDGRAVAIRTPLGKVTLRGVTVIGDVKVDRLTADNCIVLGAAFVVDAQNSCMRFSAASLDEPSWKERSLPSLYHVPKLGRIERTYFSSLRFGDPEYCQLSALAPDALHSGANGGSEMGAFYFLKRPVRLASVLAKIEEFAPVGILPQIIQQSASIG